MSEYGYVPPAENTLSKDSSTVQDFSTAPSAPAVSQGGSKKILLIVGIGCALLLCCTVMAVGGYFGYKAISDRVVSEKCIEDGESIPVDGKTYNCCGGLEQIGPKEQVPGASGYCTSQCGNGTCDTKTESSENCPEDCEENVVGCKAEGEAVIVEPDAEQCCDGLEMIQPKDADTDGIQGICTAKCGNGVCDEATETNYNCAEDCPTQNGNGGGSSADCYGEGEYVPSDWTTGQDIMDCCEGLEMILTKDLSIEPNLGICTAKCGNGICDTETESQYNCFEDCF